MERLCCHSATQETTRHNSCRFLQHTIILKSTRTNAQGKKQADWKVLHNKKLASMSRKSVAELENRLTLNVIFRSILQIIITLSIWRSSVWPTLSWRTYCLRKHFAKRCYWFGRHSQSTAYTVLYYFPGRKADSRCKWWNKIFLNFTTKQRTHTYCST